MFIKSISLGIIILLLSFVTYGQVIITPKIGVNLLGDLEFRRGGYGLGVGYVFTKFGLEVEYMRHHHFYKDTEIDKIFNLNTSHKQRPDIDTDANIFAASLIIPLKKNEKVGLYLAPGFSMYNSWFTSPKVAYNSNQKDYGFHTSVGYDFKIKKFINLNTDLKYSYAIVDKNRGWGYTQNFGFLRLTIGARFKILNENF